MDLHAQKKEIRDKFITKREELKKNGIKFSGLSVDDLVEAIEISDHPWFVATQFHPEFTSNPRDGHPLFKSFIGATIKFKNQVRN